VSRKGPADFVSKADQASERTLWDELRAARPGWGFELEEGGRIEGEPGEPRFIIDPLGRDQQLPPRRCRTSRSRSRCRNPVWTARAGAR